MFIKSHICTHESATHATEQDSTCILMPLLTLPARYITIFETLETSLYPLKSGGAVVRNRLALLGIEVTIDIVAEHGEGLTIPTMDHSPL